MRFFLGKSIQKRCKNKRENEQKRAQEKPLRNFFSMDSIKPSTAAPSTDAESWPLLLKVYCFDDRTLIN